jgi:hypothetical protein
MQKVDRIEYLCVFQKDFLDNVETFVDARHIERFAIRHLFAPRIVDVFDLAIDSSLATSASAAIERLRRLRTISNWRHRAAVNVGI